MQQYKIYGQFLQTKGFCATSFETLGHAHQHFYNEETAPNSPLNLSTCRLGL